MGHEKNIFVRVKRSVESLFDAGEIDLGVLNGGMVAVHGNAGQRQNEQYTDLFKRGTVFQMRFCKMAEASVPLDCSRGGIRPWYYALINYFNSLRPAKPKNPDGAHSF